MKKIEFITVIDKLKEKKMLSNDEQDQKKIRKILLVRTINDFIVLLKKLFILRCKNSSYPKKLNLKLFCIS